MLGYLEAAAIGSLFLMVTAVALGITGVICWMAFDAARSSRRKESA